MDTYLWNFVTLLPAGVMPWVRGRENRFMEEKHTEKYTTNTSVPHPSVSIVKDWECIKDTYSAINILIIPIHPLTDTIPSNFPIWKHLQKAEGK